MCSSSIAKFVLYFVNIVFVLLGAFLAILGAIALTSFDTFLNILKIVPEVKEVLVLMERTGTLDLFRNSSIVLLVLGLFLLIVSFLGCCGAKGDYKACLLLFSIIIGVLVVAQLAIIIWALVDKDSLVSQIETQVKRSIKEYKGTGMHYVSEGSGYRLRLSNDTAAFSWDGLQVGIGCCGSAGSGDWTSTVAPDWDNTYLVDTGDTIANATVPLSCCVVDDKEKYATDITTMIINNATQCLKAPGAGVAYTTGCVQTIVDQSTKYSTITFAVLGGTVGLQILEIICAIYLMKESDSVV